MGGFAKYVLASSLSTSSSFSETSQPISDMDIDNLIKNYNSEESNQTRAKLCEQWKIKEMKKREKALRRKEARKIHQMEVKQELAKKREPGAPPHWLQAGSYEGDYQFTRLFTLDGLTMVEMKAGRKTYHMHIDNAYCLNAWKLVRVLVKTGLKQGNFKRKIENEENTANSLPVESAGPEVNESTASE